MSGRKPQQGYGQGHGHAQRQHHAPQHTGPEFTAFVRDFPFGTSDADLFALFAPIKVGVVDFCIRISLLLNAFRSREYLRSCVASFDAVAPCDDCRCQVIRGNIVRDPQTKQQKGYAFAHFATDADMQKAITIANGHVCRLLAHLTA